MFRPLGMWQAHNMDFNDPLLIGHTVGEKRQRLILRASCNFDAYIL